MVPGSKPPAFMLSITSGGFSAFSVPSLSLSLIVAGVPAGTAQSDHEVTTRSGKPASTKVGVSGSGGRALGAGAWRSASACRRSPGPSANRCWRCHRDVAGQHVGRGRGGAAIADEGHVDAGLLLDQLHGQRWRGADAGRAVGISCRGPPWPPRSASAACRAGSRDGRPAGWAACRSSTRSRGR